MTEKEVENILMHLKGSSAGSDELRPNVMKTVKRSIVFPLMYISLFRQGFSEGIEDC